MSVTIELGSRSDLGFLFLIRISISRHGAMACSKMVILSSLLMELQVTVWKRQSMSSLVYLFFGVNFNGSDLCCRSMFGSTPSALFIFPDLVYFG